MASVALSTLDAELHRSTTPGVQHLWFHCPKCGQHRCMIPFSDAGSSDPESPVWRRVSGSTVEDLTLEPSYLVVGLCGLHGFVRAGRFEH
jgi:hypothetical protein